MRYRFIPTRRVPGLLSPLHYDAEALHLAENAADALAEQYNVRVLLCEAPVDGIVREIGFYGPEPEVKPERKAKR